MYKLLLIKSIPNTYVIKYSYSLFDIDKRMNCPEVAIVHILYAKWFTTNASSTCLSLNSVLHKSVFAMTNIYIYIYYAKGKGTESTTITCYNDKTIIRAYEYLRSGYCKRPESMNGSFRFALKRKRTQAVEDTIRLNSNRRLGNF